MLDTRYLDWFDMLQVVSRARRDPAKFLERAAWQIGPESGGFNIDAVRHLYEACYFVNRGEEIPSWVFRSQNDSAVAARR